LFTRAEKREQCAEVTSFLAIAGFDRALARPAQGKQPVAKLRRPSTDRLRRFPPTRCHAAVAGNRTPTIQRRG
jgi:hypothetical protein